MKGKGFFLKFKNMKSAAPKVCGKIESAAQAEVEIEKPSTPYFRPMNPNFICLSSGSLFSLDEREDRAETDYNEFSR